MKAIDKNIIVIVDAYSTGRYLVSAFQGHGYKCIHIIPSTKISESYLARYEQDKDLFIKTLTYNGSMTDILKELNQFNIKFIIAGSEVGVWLADELNHQLKLPLANNIQFSRARRDKYLMQNALPPLGLKAIPQLLTDNKDEIINWLVQVGLPVVLKPIASSDAEGVHFCFTEAEVDNAFNKIINSMTQYGDINHTVLAQKKIIGDEYVVNTVSYNGTHCITDIWTNRKKSVGNNAVYDYQQLVNPGTKQFQLLTQFVKQVLDALHIKYGAAHSEIIISDNTIYLIEVGARLSGGFNPSATLEVLGYSQVSTLIDAYLRPELFISQINSSKTNQRKLMIVSLIATCSGKIVMDFDTRPFMDLPSFYSMQHDLLAGSYLAKTEDLTTSPGNIYLIANNEQELFADYQKIRELEKSAYNAILINAVE